MNTLKARKQIHLKSTWNNYHLLLSRKLGQLSKEKQL